MSRPVRRQRSVRQSIQKKQARRQLVTLLVVVMLLVVGSLWAWWQSQQPTIPPEETGPDQPQQTQSTGQPPKPKYEFYRQLPNQQVEVGQPPRSLRAGEVSSPIITPPPLVLPKKQPVEPESTYFIQAGAYRLYSQAERQRSRLAALGYKSEIQEDIQTTGMMYRVRLAPLNTLSDVQAVRRALAQHGIETLAVSQP